MQGIKLSEPTKEAFHVLYGGGRKGDVKGNNQTGSGVGKISGGASG